VSYADNGSLPLGPYTAFHGVAVNESSVLIAYTRTGDANLDGVVDNLDVTIVSAFYAPGLPQPSCGPSATSITTASSMTTM
jgi:hypothetical protein